MLELMTNPWNYEFMRNALMIGTIIGVLCPIVGTYLIVQRMALMGDVIAHSVLPGLSISLFLNIDILWGAFVSGLFGSFMISWIRSQSRLKADSAMALTFSSFFALGITLITILKNKLDLDSFLFGDILGVTVFDIVRTATVTVIVLACVVVFYKEMLLYTFDKTSAQTMGLPVKRIHVGSMAAITLTIIASMKAVGVILVIAMLVGPALTAYLLVNELHHMMLLGAAIGVFSSLTGIYISYYQNLPSGPAIVLVSSLIFILTLLLNPENGLLAKLRTAQPD
jgi:manganese/iron transport system permease protein